MKVVERKVVIPHGPMRSAVCGFVTYVHPTKPTLLRRHGWEIADDIHDDFYDLLSQDNGRTWGPPVTSIKNYPTAGGTMVHTENAAIYLPQRDRLLVFTNMGLQPDPTHGHRMGNPYQLRISVSRPEDYLSVQPLVSDFGLPQGAVVSFCHPIQDRLGRILVPVQFQTPDPDGVLRQAGIKVDDRTGLALDYGQSALLMGRFNSKDQVDWTLGPSVPIAMGLSSRGLYEGTVAELSDGSLAMVLRGSNHLWPDKPGYKWMSFSRDGGQSWSQAVPFPCDDDSLIESSATGSLLFRSLSNGKLYWVGNLCIDGKRANGNMPRSPLVIAQVREHPLSLMRQTITVIDRAAAHEHPETQHSNFKLYEDRPSGEAVLYLSRYGERGYENNRWLLADHYQYRVALD